MTRIILLINTLLLALSASAAVYSVSDIPNVHLADSTRYVSDPDYILSPAALARVDSIMADIRRTTTAEAVAVIVDDIEGDDIDRPNSSPSGESAKATSTTGSSYSWQKTSAKPPYDLDTASKESCPT